MHANLTREKFILEQIVTITGLPDYETLHEQALATHGAEVGEQITQLQKDIADLRRTYPICRWVDADPLWRDASGQRVNRH